MIGIICALEQELQALLDEVEAAQHHALCGYEYVTGRLRGQDVVLCKCGVGKVNAAVCTQTLLLTWSVRLLINSGVAGALREPFEIGDICVATDLVQHDVDTTAIGDPRGLIATLQKVGGQWVAIEKISFPCARWAVDGLLAAAERIEGVRAMPGRVASGDQFVAEAETKARIVERFDASACEMEGGAVAQVCCINGVDCAVIRAISDSSSGKHHMEYREFMPMAARNSAQVVLEFLGNL